MHQHTTPLSPVEHDLATSEKRHCVQPAGVPSSALAVTAAGEDGRPAAAAIACATVAGAAGLQAALLLEEPPEA